MRRVTLTFFNSIPFSPTLSCNVWTHFTTKHYVKERVFFADCDSMTNAEDVINEISSIVSMLGSLCVMATHMWFRKYTHGSHSLQIIFWLSVTNFMYSLDILVQSFDHTSKTSKYCPYFGGFLFFFQMASYSWSGSYAVNLWYFIGKEVKEEVSESTKKKATVNSAHSKLVTCHYNHYCSWIKGCFWSF